MLWSKAKAWREKHFKTTPDKPFFLYLPTSAIHRPCLAVKEFRNKSKVGLHGDKVVELDGPEMKQLMIRIAFVAGVLVPAVGAGMGKPAGR